VDYLAHVCRLVLEETGLLPHANAGALFADELAALRPVSASQGMMIESLAEDLDAHRSAPDKEPARRLATLDAAGELHIPFTTGILVGIGDDRPGQLAALQAIAASHARFGHVQEVIVQNFLPKPGTAMAKAAPCPPRTCCGPSRWPASSCRPRCTCRRRRTSPTTWPAARCRHRRLGRGLAGHGRPREPRAGLAGARHVARRHRGRRPRAGGPPDHLPAFAHDAETWLDPALRFPVLDVSDAEGLARDADWCSGGEVAPPRWWVGPERRHCGSPVPSSRCGPVAEVLDGVALGQEVGHDEIVTLFSARGPEVRMVAEVADDMRAPSWATPSPSCTTATSTTPTSARSSAASAPSPRARSRLNLRGAPYLLELDEITRRVAEAEAEGATEVCLQGGIHPNFDGDYYVHVLGRCGPASERIHIHGFTALEVTEGARRSEVPLAEYLVRSRRPG
jgi:hypothetical protein